MSVRRARATAKYALWILLGAFVLKGAVRFPGLAGDIASVLSMLFLFVVCGLIAETLWGKPDGSNDE